MRHGIKELFTRRAIHQRVVATAMNITGSNTGLKQDGIWTVPDTETSKSLKLWCRIGDSNT